MCVAALIVGIMPLEHSELMHDQGASLTASWWFQPHMSNWQTFPKAMSICFFSYCCHVNLFATYRDLDEPTSRRVYKVLIKSVVLQFVVFALVGLGGFLALGPPCDDHIEVPSPNA